MIARAASAAMSVRRMPGSRMAPREPRLSFLRDTCSCWDGSLCIRSKELDAEALDGKNLKLALQKEGRLTQQTFDLLKTVGLGI